MLVDDRVDSFDSERSVLTVPSRTMPKVLTLEFTLRF